ncbi:hypothetical protein GE09DRAFT_545013 [Coniochaeta sp. 2T2.1]|nr:hypothetical protein GE09DRAFT_545013 [Coniochaeta sp. 2T2.1]
MSLSSSTIRSGPGFNSRRESPPSGIFFANFGFSCVYYITDGRMLDGMMCLSLLFLLIIYASRACLHVFPSSRDTNSTSPLSARMHFVPCEMSEASTGHLTPILRNRVPCSAAAATLGVHLVR